MADATSTPPAPSCQAGPETGVYCILNTANGKVYVGSAARSFAKRWDEHRNDLKAGRHRNGYLQKAWNKHGPGAFEFTPVIACDPPDCLMWEQECMDVLRAADRSCGYNISPTAASSLGIKRSAATCAKRGEITRARFASPEVRKRQSEAIRNYFKDPAARARTAAASRRYYEQPGARERTSEATRAGMADPAVRAKMVASRAGKPFSEQHRANLSKAGTGRVHTAEARAKISAAKRGKPEKPQSAEVRAKRSASLRKHWADPENKAKMREAMRRRWADAAGRAALMGARATPRLAGGDP